MSMTVPGNIHRECRILFLAARPSPANHVERLTGGLTRFLIWRVTSLLTRMPVRAPHASPAFSFVQPIRASHRQLQQTRSMLLRLAQTDWLIFMAVLIVSTRL